MKNRSLPAAGAALILTLAGFGLAGPAAAASEKSANNPGPYDSTACLDVAGDPCASANGNGNGKAVGRPAAGTVGKADDKNPPGQLEDQPIADPTGEVASPDPNQGYECEDGQNKGVGKGNPAHSGCEFVPEEEEEVIPE